MAAHLASCAGWVFWMRAVEEILQAAALASERLRKWPGAAFEGFDFPQALVATKAPWVWGGVVSLSTRRILVQPEQRLPASCLVLGNGLASFSFKPDTSRQPAGTPRGEPSRGRGEPSAQDSCPRPRILAQHQRGWPKGPVVKNIITLSVQSLPTLTLPPAARSLFLISENRLPDKGQDLKLVQRLPNRRGGFNFPLAAS